MPSSLSASRTQHDGVLSNTKATGITISSPVCWMQSLLRETERAGARPTALVLVKACQGFKEDSESSLREFAIQTLQELEALRVAASRKVADHPPPSPPTSTAAKTTEQSRSFALPYSIHFHVESNESLFDVWQSLFGQPDPDHPLNQASLSARCFFSHDPSHADQLLWAKQAWEHPEIEALIQRLDKKELLHWDKKELLSTIEGEASSTLERNRMHLSTWIQKWCEPFQITTEEWILLLPWKDFCMDHSSGNPSSFASSDSGGGSTKNKCASTLLVQQLADEQWDWLHLTLRNAFSKWRLDAMFPTLVDPTLSEHWKPPPPTNISDEEEHLVVIQCLVFIARVHCTMAALQRRALESLTLLHNILRCAHLLQHHRQHTHAHPTHRTKIIVPTTTREDYQADEHSVSRFTKNDERRVVLADEQQDDKHSRGSNNQKRATSATVLITKQPTTTTAINATDNSQQTGNSSSAKHQHQHHPNVASTSDSQAAKSLPANKQHQPIDASTHDSQAAKSSSAKKQHQQPPSANNESCSKPSNNSLDKIYWIASLPTDPFVVPLLTEHRPDSIHRILDHPVEKLDPSGGRVLEGFATGHLGFLCSDWPEP